MKRISADTLRGFIEAILSLVCDQRLSGFKDQVYILNNLTIRKSRVLKIFENFFFENF